MCDIEAETARYYHDHAQAFAADQDMGIDPYMFNWLWEATKQFTDDLLLIDIGCGIGRMYSYTFDLGISRYIGVDQSEPTIEIARNAHHGADFRVGSILKLEEVVTERGNLFTCSNVLYHVSRLQTEKALTSIRNVITDGAIGFFELSYGLRDRVVTHKDLDFLPEGYAVGVTEWTEDTLFPLLQQTRFQVLGAVVNGNCWILAVQAI